MGTVGDSFSRPVNCAWKAVCKQVDGTLALRDKCLVNFMVFRELLIDKHRDVIIPPRFGGSL